MCIAALVDDDVVEDNGDDSFDSGDDEYTVPRSLLATVNVHTVCCDGDRDGVNDVDFTVKSFGDGCFVNEGVEYEDDVVDNVGDGDKEFNGDEVDDKTFGRDDDNTSLLAMVFGSQCVGIIVVDEVVDDVVDDGCADP